MMLPLCPQTPAFSGTMAPWMGKTVSPQMRFVAALLFLAGCMTVYAQTRGLAAADVLSGDDMRFLEEITAAVVQESRVAPGP